MPWKPSPMMSPTKREWQTNKPCLHIRRKQWRKTWVVKIRGRNSVARQEGIPVQSVYVPPKKVTLGSTARTSSNCWLPVGLINKDGTKVTNYIDKSKHQSISRNHCKVTSFFISWDFTTCIISRDIKGTLLCPIKTVDNFTFSSIHWDSIIQEGINLITRIELDIN